MNNINYVSRVILNTCRLSINIDFPFIYMGGENLPTEEEGIQILPYIDEDQSFNNRKLKILEILSS